MNNSLQFMQTKRVSHDFLSLSVIGLSATYRLMPSFREKQGLYARPGSVTLVVEITDSVSGPRLVVRGALG